MKEEMLNEYIQKLKSANTSTEVDAVIDEIIPFLKSAGIPISQLLLYLKINGNGSGYETRSQDHRNSISNSNKAQIILEKLMAKLKE